MKYRKRPVVIEAFKYNGDTQAQDGKYYVPVWAQKALKEGIMFFDTRDSDSPPCELYIKTLEGIHRASVGDYIIQGVKGELYPCKPDIFEQTYEIIDYDDALVSKGDVLARNVDSDTVEAFEVILADDTVFVVAPVVYDVENKCYMTDYEKMEAYSNELLINTLESLGFTKSKDIEK